MNSFISIILFGCITYIIRICLSPIISFILGILLEWNKCWVFNNEWWFSKGTQIKDIIEDFHKNEFYDMYNELFYVPIFGFFAFYLHFTWLLIINIICIVIILPVKLSFLFIIVPFVLYILKPIYKFIVKIINWIYNTLKLDNVIILYDKIIDFILNIRIS